MLGTLKWVEVVLLLAAGVCASNANGRVRARATIVTVVAFMVVYGIKTAFFPTTRYEEQAPFRSAYLALLAIHAIAVPIGLASGAVALVQVRRGAGPTAAAWRSRFVLAWRVAALAGLAAFALLEGFGR